MPDIISQYDGSNLTWTAREILEMTAEGRLSYEESVTWLIDTILTLQKQAAQKASDDQYRLSQNFYSDSELDPWMDHRY